jgi:NAD(P)-dependent dehydrogenase (short-subunit alcohol dehydrogenase family)
VLAEATRTALITGGTGGLGGAVTETLLAQGWRCVVPFAVAREARALEQRISDAELRGRLQLIEADLFEADAVSAVVADADDAHAPLAAAVNLIGGFDAPGRVHETPVERFDAQLRTNLRATYLVCAAAIARMLPRANGSIVCVSSRAALRPFAGAAGYATAKAAVLAFVASLASEYTADGIRANAIVPSVIDTPANRASQPDADHTRWVKPHEIARVIAFLCSADASAVSGAQIPVYGRS